MITLLAFVGLTATAVSFCDEALPRNPGALWFVHSWFTRTLVAEWSAHPPDVVVGARAAGAGALGCARAPAAGAGCISTATVPEMGLRYLGRCVPVAVAPFNRNGTMNVTNPAISRDRRMLPP